MKRSTEFRAWDGKHMLTAFVMNAQGDCFNDKGIQRHWKLLEFTGLLDKNGVKIFEGDIVRLYRPDDDKFKWVSVLVVEWFVEYAAFMLALNTEIFKGRKNTTLDDRDNMSYAQRYEVIGNIYQNSDLLEEYPV